MILLDTNLLVRMTNSADPDCAVARRAIQMLIDRRERLVIVPQGLYEFWAVATRKAGGAPSGQNGLGMTPAQASQWMAFFQRRFTLLADREDLPARWHTLVRTLAITGFRSHDARLIAAMESHGVPRLLTLNPDDFRRFTTTVLDPSAV
ncbi:MAG: type II toxin-antitoxin system VapC family toxin [Phycisphaerales bacterium]